MSLFSRGGDQPVRVLDIDIENGPGFYLGQDFTTAQLLVVATCWVGEPDSMEVLRPHYCCGRQPHEHTLESAIRAFVQRYNEADVITGHYLRKHDLPILNGCALRVGLPPLGPRLVSDTKLDVRTSGGVSLSQENLAYVRGVDVKKLNVPAAEWEAARECNPDAVKAMLARVAGDVRQHMKLRAALLERGWLKPATVWAP